MAVGIPAAAFLTRQTTATPESPDARLVEVLVSKKELADAVWGYYDPDVGRTLEVHVRRLRTKLKSTAALSPSLETVRSFGYRLTAGL